jgi:ADP-L-glycero-D-manno-heptose 6-epimerase
MLIAENVDFVDTPEDLQGKYQYYTCANIQKLRGIGYSEQFYTLEDGIGDYVRTYLSSGKRY